MPRTLLLRSLWQTENIGDIAHAPGMLRLLQRHLPDHRVILWAGQADRGVVDVLRAACPNLAGVVLKTEDATDAIQSADLLLHGSGPSLVGEPEVRRWRDLCGTRKPWGALGVTLNHTWPELLELLDSAAFVYTRETASLEVVRSAGGRADGFFPDSTLACDLRDDAAADATLRRIGLAGEAGFLCVIPRLRRTPYYRIHPNAWWTPDRIREVDELNAKWAEDDHAKLREVIIRWVDQTGRRVLVCAEMAYQMELLTPLLVRGLPERVRSKVAVLDRYWLTAEAASVYARAGGIVGFECHSPLISAVQGVTGIYVRQPEDTIKGQMYPDLGWGDRKIEVDDVDARGLADRVIATLSAPDRDERTRWGVERAEAAQADVLARVRGLLA